jgi:hypothetical protein
MKRKDATRKVRTICQRLDEVDPDTSLFRPLKLYLYGSLLTDKPDPEDVDLILVYQRTPAYQEYLESEESCYQEIYYMRQHRKFSSQLRRGMKMIRLELVQDTLRWSSNWALFLLGEELRLIWKPDFDWTAVLDEIERHPRPWTGPQPRETKERVTALLKEMPYEERDAKSARVLAEINAQG